MKSKSAWLLAALVACAPVVNAQILTFRFTGTVNESLPMAPVGSEVTGTFSYDTSTQPYASAGEQAGPGSGDASYLAQTNINLMVNGHTVTAGVTTVYVFNNFGGNVEDGICVDGALMTLDGTLFAEGNVGFCLYSGPGKTHVLRTTDLPSRIHVNRFDASRGGQVMIDGGGNGVVLSFLIDWIREEKQLEE